MYSFSKKVLIDIEKIYFKRSKTEFRINIKAYNQLLAWYKNNFENFNKNSAFCKVLIEEKIIVKNGVDYNPFVERVLGPQRVFVQLTDKCNLMCEHCYAEGRPYNKNELDIYELIEFLSMSIRNGVREIDFTGGEIFTYPSIWELLEWIDMQPIKTVLFSNLTLVTEEQLNKIVNISSVVKIVTSIDYFTAERHNRFRHGINAYEITMKAIDYLNRTDVKVVVNTMVMSDNHNEVVDIVNYFKERGIRVVLDTIISEGRMKNKSKNEIERKVNCLVCSTLSGENFDSKSFKVNYLKPYNDNVYIKICGVGKRMVYLTCDGKIALCPSLTKYSMNMHYSKIVEFKSIIDYIKNFQSLSCKYSDCKKYKECGGGCRARAFINTGDIFEKDIESCYKFGVE